MLKFKNRIMFCSKSFVIILMFALFFSLFYKSGMVYGESSSKNDSKYYSHLSQDGIKDIFKLKTKDISDPWVWIAEAKTYVVVEKDSSNNYTYWWNTPNLQMSVQNSLYGLITMSGYGNGFGEKPQDSEWLVKLGEANKANTALKKYGFSIPSPTYVGERPLVTISISGVLLPDNIWSSIGRLGDFIFKGNIVSAPTSDDKNSLLYIAPRDYELYNITFEHWVEKNWYDAIGNIENGQILLSSADQATGKWTDGKFWIKQNIIDKNGLSNPNLKAKDICQTLEEICGPNYSDVAKNIILTSKLPKNHQTQRIMPYDLSKMDSKDAAMFKGVVDPRSDMQQSAFKTGYNHLVSVMFKSCYLSISGKLSEISIALNSLTNFTFIENLGFNPIELWNSTIIQFLTLIMLAALIFFIVKSGLKVLSGNGSSILIVTKAFFIFFIIIISVNIGNNKENTYKSIKNISTSIFNLSNISFKNSYGLSPLYGTGNAADKENVTLWMPYFNAWTSYNTNHSILNPEQTINKNSNTPEVKGIAIPKIDGVEQTVWSAVLADTFTTAENYSGNIYRVVDHFMAPRVTNLQLNGNTINSIDVSKNENYNGNVQSSTDLSNLLFQFLILVLILVKVMLFFEFIVNISMLLFNVALSILDKYKLVTVLKELGASMLNICAVNLIINLIVWTNLIVTNGFSSYAIFILYVFLLYSLAKQLMCSSSVFTPKFIRPMQRAYSKTKYMFESGGNQ